MEPSIEETLQSTDITLKRREKRIKKDEVLSTGKTVSHQENNFEIRAGEKLFLDGFELKGVSYYELQHHAGKQAELTVILRVNVNPPGFGLEK